MSNYPNYQDNRLIVDGVDLTTNFQMILIDGYVLSPPEPKFYQIDIPGGNGMIDLTESLAGDVLFSKRSQDFYFKLIYPNDFERIKTRLSNFLHGKAYDYEISFDPGYTYHGRFTVSSYSHDPLAEGILGDIQIHIDADPYKMKELQVYRLNANAGKRYYFLSGRMPVRPIIETSQPTSIVFNGERTNVEVGTFRLNNVLFKEGINEIYFNTFHYATTKWQDLYLEGSAQMTWEEAQEYTWDKLGSLIIETGDGNSYSTYGEDSSPSTDSAEWSDMVQFRWNDLRNKQISWKDLYFYTGSDSEENSSSKSFGAATAIITYEWGDL